MKIVLIRHGKTKGNIEKRFNGVTDDNLHEIGMSEIEALVASGIYPKVGRVYTSPLKRCVETAAIIYPEHKNIVVKNLQEINFGKLENLTYDEIIVMPGFENFQWDPVDMAFPGGDDMASFKKRCAEAFREIIETENLETENLETENLETASPKTVDKVFAIVVHGGVINAIMNHLFGEQDNIVVGNGLGFIINYEDNKYSYTFLDGMAEFDESLSSYTQKRNEKR